MSKIEHLIISSKIDFSTDLICSEFEKRNLSYIRINRDQFSNYNILYNLSEEKLYVENAEEMYEISNQSLKSIYFRAPVFLRSNNKNYSLTEQLYRSQWSSFIRNLIIFDNAVWMNNPVDTYRAENKLYQLKVAQQYGLNIPRTLTGNSLPADINYDKLYVVKSLDTALFYDNQQEMFTYSIIIPGHELIKSNLKMAPVFIQEYISPKIDIRVTVIGDKMFAAKILSNNKGIEGDWRRGKKEDLVYEDYNLPEDIKLRIHGVMKHFNLNFGGVDLILTGDNYYFIEVNPTGEWGWLVSTAKQNIDSTIVDFLSTSKNNEQTI